MNSAAVATPLDLMTARRRSNSRARLGIPAQLELVCGLYPCRLENLSVGGARLHFVRHPRVGSHGVCHFEGYEAFGEIAWTSTSACGFRFDQPVPEEFVVSLRHSTGEILGRYQASVIQYARNWVTGEA